MTKPKTRTISGPFDARHVGGVSIPGVTIPIAGIQRSSTTSGLEPDETPSHTFVANGNVEVPRRSNTIASSLSRPSLRLKTSMSILRGRSSSNSPDTYRRKDRVQTSDPQGSSLQKGMPVQSLRKKPSTSRLWGRTHHDTPAKTVPPKSNEPERAAAPPPPPPPPPAAPVETSILTLSRKPSTLRTSSQSIAKPSEQYKSPYAYNPTPPSPPPPLPTKEQPPVRPKRADSGTAIDFNDTPAQERPLGFREILAVSSFEERMALYKKTREYWANADHGLEEWVGRAAVRRPVVSRT
ncbi:hypothetical protein K458DRAFT_180541 [Lentithecium fluviatile CBS 122367]|uniref:Uncharacterized protein n=1 Tax=Lentithecium fluviatile CBS 122367 TaxID=1168545 RepID=A0A6G1IEH2_9PLEO|nr:hypothetical protein K458DRAFT_180541 [Lentithecium fluviatile CBS 122367]